MNPQIIFPIPRIKCSEALRPHLDLIFRGEYDIPLYGAYRILDIGANVGAFSIWAAHRFPGSRIYAYEPSIENFAMFEENTAPVYGINGNNWGIGRPGIRPLYHGRRNEGEASLFASCGGASTTGYHVEVKDPNTLPEADILKVDTEGAEREIILPLLEDGRRFITVMFEYHSVADRRILDEALSKDYILIGAQVMEPARGVMKYLNRSFVEGQ